MQHIQDKEAPAAGSVAQRWIGRPLSELVDHIITDYHEPLRQELARLQAQLEAARAHETPGDRQLFLAGSWDCFVVLCDELLLHMEKEERVLFPWLRGERASSAKAPIQIVKHEHTRAEALLAELQRLRQRYRQALESPDASHELRTALGGLDGLERSMREHLELEELLFGQALTQA